MNRRPLRLIFINSSSNSGSTLLEALLATQSGVHTLGEVGVLGRSIRRNDLCSCAETLTKCKVWSKLEANVLQSQLDDELEKFLNTSSFPTRWFLYCYMLFFRPPGRFKGMITRYAQSAEDTFLNYIDVQEKECGEAANWLVDATKSHWRLQWLQSSGLFDIRVIHLVKDPRAYVHSMDKTYTIRKSTSTDATKSAVKLAYRWATANLSMFVLHHLRFRKESRFFIRYDDLASAHLVAMQKICDWIGVPFDAERAMRFRENRDHAIGGNPMRAESRPVQLDNEWHSALDPGRSRRIWAVAWPLAKLFGFRRRTSGNESR